MTFQPSVMIWTVISFVIFMFVADRLLFRPVFRVMDARQEKIAAAHAVSAAAAEAAAAQTGAVPLPPETRAPEASPEAKDGKRDALRLAEARSEAQLRACRRELEIRRSELKAGLDDEEERLAAEFAAKLIS